LNASKSGRKVADRKREGEPMLTTNLTSPNNWAPVPGGNVRHWEEGWLEHGEMVKKEWTYLNGTHEGLRDGYSSKKVCLLFATNYTSLKNWGEKRKPRLRVGAEEAFVEYLGGGGEKNRKCQGKGNGK